MTTLSASITYPLLPVNVHMSLVPAMQEWTSIAEEYESNPASLRGAWLYLGHHPAFWALQESAEGCHVATGTAWYRCIETGVEEDSSVWLEIFPSLWPEDLTWEEFHEAAPHLPDWRLNITAGTYEEAVKIAAWTVHTQYGNDREFLNSPLQGKWQG